ncbi:ankyrin repeat-containing domain protein [Flagelloscypha sp. PMI_526]|nr:ankyrin repeat-containing domain protein [Flagelloscypha sp. PMI_526]
MATAHSPDLETRFQYSCPERNHMSMVIKEPQVRAVDGETWVILVPRFECVIFSLRFSDFQLSILSVGTGKSVMSSFVIETLLARDDVYVAYYYFEFTNPTTLSEEAVLRSLVCQLARASPTVMRTFHEKHSKGSLQPRLTTLQDTLNELVSVSAKPVFIIIDALDELPLAQRKYFLQTLLTFSSSNTASPMHVMVTSREEVDIHRAFKGAVDFKLAVQGNLVRQDIAAFVDQELAAQKWKYWPRNAIEAARRLLNERAAGQFRMVACQVDILQQVKTYEQLQGALNSLPKTLSETYDYILEKIPKHLRHQAHRLFAFLSFTSTPISTDELTALLAVEFGDEDDSNQIPKFQETTRMLDPLDVVDLGSSLVSRRSSFYDNHLQLAHASVKEDFLTPSDAWFSLSEYVAHGMIARSCLALVSHFQSVATSRRARYSFSTTQWFHHVLPNGPPQLLHQQQQIYNSSLWLHIVPGRNTSKYRGRISPLASAAYLGLFDLIKAILNTRPWEKNDLALALVEAAASDRAEDISILCCHALMTSGAHANSSAIDTSRYAINEHISPLQSASTNGNLAIAQFLLDNGADINAVGGKCGTALQAVNDTFHGQPETIRFLIEKGADVNMVAGRFGTALQAGVFMRNLETVRVLVEMGADVNAIGGEFGSALQAGSFRGDVETLRFLVEKGANVNASGGKYGSPLQAGAYAGGLEAVRFLVEKGADVKASGGEFGSALQAASGAYHENLEVVRFLAEKGADVNASGGYYGSALQAGVWHGSLEIVRFLVEKGADVNASGGKYGSPLQAGVYVGGLDPVRFLEEKGLDVNANGGAYGSAFQAGAYHRSLEVVRVLVENGADVNVSGGEYGSALQAGAYYGSLEVVRFLVENGAHVNASGGTYGSALQAGAFCERLEVVHFLVERGADVNASGGLCGSSLQAGAWRGSLKIIRFLIKKGAHVNASGGRYGSALQAGAYCGSLEVVRFLVEKGAHVNASGGYYGSALQAGAYCGSLEVVRLLVEKGADVNAGGGYYGSALQAGAYCGSLDVVRFLVEKGADVNAIGGYHKTALNAAQDSDEWTWRQTQKDEVVQFLTSSGALTWPEM